MSTEEKDANPAKYDNTPGKEWHKQELVGEACIYVDPKGVEFNALVTGVWGPNCINLVTLVSDVNQTDSCGRKTVRYTSCMHKNVQEAHGNYWYIKQS